MQRNERIGLRLSYAVPKIRWASIVPTVNLYLINVVVQSFACELCLIAEMRYVALAGDFHSYPSMPFQEFYDNRLFNFFVQITLHTYIYMLSVFTEKPYSKPFERNVVYIPIIKSSLKINHGCVQSD